MELKALDGTPVSPNGARAGPTEAALNDLLGAGRAYGVTSMDDNASEQQARPLLIEHEIKVSTYDIDFAGHVSNISYLRWLEDMRLAMFDRHFPLDRFLSQGITPVLASTKIHYRRPIRLFDRPRGIMWVRSVGKSSLVIEAEIHVDGAVTTNVEHVGVFITLESGRPVRLPEICKEKFLADRGGGAAAREAERSSVRGSR